MKFSVDIELMDADLLATYGQVCGWVLARAHAKASGHAAEISGISAPATAWPSP